MEKCSFESCSKLIDSRYKFCYAHRKEKYTAKCKYHGETIFSEGNCLECKSFMKPIYRIYYRDGKYWIGHKLAPKDHHTSEYFKFLLHRNRRNAMKFLGNVTTGPGIYGIFKRSKGGLGQCLYIGQSLNVKKRVEEHQDNIVKAINKEKCIPTMYNELLTVGVKNIKFVKLISLNKKFNTIEELFESLTIFEQFYMDSFEPTINVIAARKSDDLFIK